MNKHGAENLKVALDHVVSEGYRVEIGRAPTEAPTWYVQIISEHPNERISIRFYSPNYWLKFR